jgi:hypothetical protein
MLLNSFSLHISQGSHNKSHRIYATYLIVFTLHSSSCWYGILSSCLHHISPRANYILVRHPSHDLSHYILNTHFIVFTLRISSCFHHISHRVYCTYFTVHTMYPTVLKLHISPCSSTSHRIPTTHLIVFTLYISQRCFYIPHLTHCVSHRFRNINGTEFSLPVSSCSRYVSHRLTVNSHFLSHRVHTTYLSVSLLILTSCLIVFTLHISPTYYYVFSCVYTAYPIVLPLLNWPCSHYVLDCSCCILECNIVTELYQRVRTTCTP